MTTPSQIREWAEAAGLKQIAEGRWVLGNPFRDGDDARWYLPNDPALLPLIAERLVERVPHNQHGLIALHLVTAMGVGCLASATAAQRAEAAYAVLQDSEKKSEPDPKPLTECKSGQDGECYHPMCPQTRDNEPDATGRDCLLPWHRWGDRS